MATDNPQQEIKRLHNAAREAYVQWMLTQRVEKDGLKAAWDAAEKAFNDYLAKVFAT